MENKVKILILVFAVILIILFAAAVDDGFKATLLGATGGTAATILTQIGGGVQWIADVVSVDATTFTFYSLLLIFAVGVSFTLGFQWLRNAGKIPGLKPVQPTIIYQGPPATQAPQTITYQGLPAGTTVVQTPVKPETK